MCVFWQENKKTHGIGRSGVFQLKPIAKNGAWVLGDPFYVYVG